MEDKENPIAKLFRKALGFVGSRLPRFEMPSKTYNYTFNRPTPTPAPTPTPTPPPPPAARTFVQPLPTQRATPLLRSTYEAIEPNLPHATRSALFAREA